MRKYSTVSALKWTDILGINITTQKGKSNEEMKVYIPIIPKFHSAFT